MLNATNHSFPPGEQVIKHSPGHHRPQPRKACVSETDLEMILKEKARLSLRKHWEQSRFHLPQAPLQCKLCSRGLCEVIVCCHCVRCEPALVLSFRMGSTKSRWQAKEREATLEGATHPKTLLSFLLPQGSLPHSGSEPRGHCCGRSLSTPRPQLTRLPHFSDPLEKHRPWWHND